MKEQFVTYEIALKLKELGFNEPCFRKWSWYYNPYFGGIEKQETALLINYDTEQYEKLNEFPRKYCLAPLWQQTIDWFRDNYNIHIEIRNYQEYQKDNYAHVLNFIKDSNYLDKDGNKIGQIISRIYYNNYQEAREQAILKVIEIIKNK